MNEKQAKKTRLFLMATWFFMLVITILILLNYTQTPKSGEPGKNGLAGVQGPEGPQGPIGPVHTVQIPKVTVIEGQPGNPGQPGQDGKDGKDGKDGEPGIPGKEIELRRNPENGDLEWKYVTEDFWTVLIDGCDLTPCEEQ